MQHIVDLKNGTVKGLTVPPKSLNANANGVGCDMAGGEGPRSGAIVNLGTLDANTVFSVTIEESDDNTTFGALADTANTNTGNLNTSNTQTMLGFQRSKRYLRGKVAISGTNAAGLISVEFIEQKKVEGDNPGGSATA